MYRLFTLLWVAFLVGAVPALAESGDNMIRIINKDGSVTEFEIPAEKRLPPPAQPETAPAPATSPAPEAPSLAPQTALPEAAAPAPSPEPVLAPESTAPPKAKIVKVKKKAKPRVFVPTPRHKPLATLALPPASPPQAPGEITREQAITIALEVAPPARSMDVERRSYEDRIVYVVAFRTDDGVQDVLVDAKSGDIVTVLEKARSVPKPGHLPAVP